MWLTKSILLSGAYEWFWRSLKEELSSKEKFYSSLTGKKNSDKEYEYLLKVWDKLDIKTIKDYLDWHLKCTVLLLTDVFERFRNSSLKNYRLCPSHYLSAPALSSDIRLNTTKVELELIFDSDMYLYEYERWSVLHF